MMLRTVAMTALLSMGVSMAETESNALMISPLSAKHNVGVELDMEAGRFSVHGGCNALMGSVEIDENDQFLVEPNRMATTMMACSGDLQTLDQRITQFMAQAPKVVRQGDALYLVGTIEGESDSHYLPINLDKGSYKDVEARSYEKIFIYVAAETKPCTLAESEEQAQCLQIRYEEDEKWQVFNGEIRGFTPEAGVEYRLRLKSYENEDDATDWELDMIVEQGLVE